MDSAEGYRNGYGKPRQPIGARTYSTADVGSWTTGRRTSVESLNKSLIVEPSRCGRIGSSPCLHRLGHSFNDAHGRCFAFSEEGGATLEGLTSPF